MIRVITSPFVPILTLTEWILPAEYTVTVAE